MSEVPFVDPQIVDEERRVRVKALPMSAPPIQFAVEQKREGEFVTIGYVEGAHIPDKGYHRNHGWRLLDVDKQTVLGDAGSIADACRALSAR